MEYPDVPRVLIMEFLEIKGFSRMRDDLSTFYDDQSGSLEIELDVESETVNLGLLLQDWTAQGARELAEELVTWLGANPNF